MADVTAQWVLDAYCHFMCTHFGTKPSSKLKETFGRRQGFQICPHQFVRPPNVSPPGMCPRTLNPLQRRGRCCSLCMCNTTLHRGPVPAQCICNTSTPTVATCRYRTPPTDSVHNRSRICTQPADSVYRLHPPLPVVLARGWDEPEVRRLHKTYHQTNLWAVPRGIS